MDFCPLSGTRVSEGHSAVHLKDRTGKNGVLLSLGILPQSLHTLSSLGSVNSSLWHLANEQEISRNLAITAYNAPRM
jgi:hypothetical protein